MTDFTYKGVLVTENWPTAARMKGATRPSYERWTATFDDLTTLHGNTQQEVKDAITVRLEELTAEREATADPVLHDAARQLIALTKQVHPRWAEEDQFVHAMKLLKLLVGRTEADLVQVLMQATELEAAANGDPAECFDSPDALIEAVNETRAQQEVTANG